MVNEGSLAIRNIDSVFKNSLICKKISRGKLGLSFLSRRKNLSYNEKNNLIKGGFIMEILLAIIIAIFLIGVIVFIKIGEGLLNILSKGFEALIDLLRKERR